ncbi:hypothetical protein BGW80DRAFT_1447741 [Lactifluus volemus]|nr:hypothetical protein BGW80DRAFT_1447741 [Lactifluus volemus]
MASSHGKSRTHCDKEDKERKRNVRTRIETLSRLAPSVLVWTLSAEDGVEVATHCKSIPSAHDTDDVHVEIRELVRLSQDVQARPHLQRHRSGPSAFLHCRQLPNRAEVIPSIEETGWRILHLRASKPRQDLPHHGRTRCPSSARVMTPTSSTSTATPASPARAVLLFGDVAVEKHIIIKQLESRLKDAGQMDERTPRRSRIRSSPVGGREEGDRSPR